MCRLRCTLERFHLSLDERARAQPDHKVEVQPRDSSHEHEETVLEVVEIFLAELRSNPDGAQVGASESQRFEDQHRRAAHARGVCARACALFLLLALFCFDNWFAWTLSMGVDTPVSQGGDRGGRTAVSRGQDETLLDPVLVCRRSRAKASGHSLR